MATAALIGGGLVVGGLLAGQGAKESAKKQAEAAQANLAAAQQFQTGQMDIANQFIPGAVQAQQAQLGLLGQGGDAQAAQNLMNSPLVQALNQQNQQNITAQAAASGVSGGNLLNALQQANTATILNAGLQGLGGIASQGIGAGAAFSGNAANALNMGMNAQTQLGQAQGAQAAIPWLTGANIINQGTSMLGFGLGGGFGSQVQQGLQNWALPGQMPMAGTSYVQSSMPQTPVGVQGNAFGPLAQPIIL